MAAELPEKNFPEVQRVITTHEKSGRTTFETGVPESVSWERSNIGADFFLAYTLAGFPVPLTDDADLQTYKGHLANKPPFMIPGGGVVRYVDYHPGGEPVWHRTVTLDIGVVVEGEIELELDSGEKRLLRRGDVAIQRGSNHRWRNPSDTNFARALYIALDAKPVVIDGQELGESLGKVSGH
ncbi:hypothetical protein B0J12DRAFT_611665 [Macrophomina phaseolina]|uniref:Cupin type-2 domain-containing protein n=1 Tax=Macrophomina phaseolina TaxID=35725 RepID=A0ABQ8FQ60_9PEZI|nr:hypothetical protein B0J12DRAFT_611665 [Macrophomina phaseolina]